MPQCTQMPSSLGFLYFHPYLFLKKKIANIYKHKALFLFILEWHHIHTICFLSPDIAEATYHRQPFHFSGCWASLPWLCHYLVEQYHSWAFELILDIVHVMSHFTCVSTVSIQKWETTHTDFWKALIDSAFQRLVLFTCRLPSDSAAHPQHPCQRWYSDATLGQCGLPNYIKWTTFNIWKHLLALLTDLCPLWPRGYQNLTC